MSTAMCHLVGYFDKWRNREYFFDIPHRSCSRAACAFTTRYLTDCRLGCALCLDDLLFLLSPPQLATGLRLLWSDVQPVVVVVVIGTEEEEEEEAEGPAHSASSEIFLPPKQKLRPEASACTRTRFLRRSLNRSLSKVKSASRTGFRCSHGHMNPACEISTFDRS